MHTLYQGDNVSVMRALIPDESIPNYLGAIQAIPCH